MAKRLLPYRDYSEHDVVNLFSLDVTDAALTAYGKDLPDFLEAESGAWDSGVVVSVEAGELPGDLPDVSATTIAGTDKLQKYMTGADLSNAYVGFNVYPSNGMTVRPADAGTSRPLGITLRETLAYDENGEKMLYYKQKLDEAFAVLPGHSVSVLTRGTILLAATAFSGAIAIGDDLEVADGGKLAAAGGTNPVVGKVIARGYEVKQGERTKTAEDDDAVTKLLCQLSF